MTKPILELKDVKTTVKTADGEIVPILKGINLEIRPGDFITIIGTNGAGKSTLFNTIAGSLKPDSGILRHNGQDITKMSEEKRTQFIGRVFQDPKMGTAPRMTVAENLLLATKRGKRRFLKIRRLKQNLPRFKKLAAVMNNGLESRLNTFVEGLSGGQRQALSFLMATIEKPDILLLDEHTAALDPKTSLKIMEITEKIVKDTNITTMMVTHNLKQAIKTGNRLIMMHRGKILIDVKGKEKEELTTEKLMNLFKDANINDDLSDRSLLA